MRVKGGILEGLGSTDDMRSGLMKDRRFCLDCFCLMGMGYLKCFSGAGVTGSALQLREVWMPSCLMLVHC